ncbi:MAG: hypothetical protein BGN82_07595 [Alphaproteobacteria bacterium 65-7]|nr:MAG: hypothetical protein BGN82_07595 [Alphaproteobacteria bacterium 65-7]
MKTLSLLLCALLLAGCSDLERWTSFQRSDAPDMAEAAAPPPATQMSATQVQAAPAPLAAQQPVLNPFCQSVAAQDAAGNGFDTATQQRMIQRSYAQCSAIFGAR